MKIERFSKLASTNDYAIEKIREGAIDSDYAIIAEEQTQGKGRLNGRVWKSPKGNFYCSYIINLEKLNVSRNECNLLTSVSISALKDFVSQLANTSKIQMKIPNDLLVENKKIAGVLVEVSFPYAVVGIGLNLAVSPIERATNLRSEFNILVKPEEIVENLYNKLIAGIRNAFVHKISI